MKCAGILAILAAASGLSAQVASQANSGYQTEEQRQNVAKGLADPARDEKQKPMELIRDAGIRAAGDDNRVIDAP